MRQAYTDEQYKQMVQMVEADLDHKIKDLKNLEERAAKIKGAMALIKAALTDSGHSNLAVVIENQVSRL